MRRVYHLRLETSGLAELGDKCVMVWASRHVVLDFESSGRYLGKKVAARSETSSDRNDIEVFLEIVRNPSWFRRHKAA